MQSGTLSHPPSLARSLSFVNHFVIVVPPLPLSPTSAMAAFTPPAESHSPYVHRLRDDGDEFTQHSLNLSLFFHSPKRTAARGEGAQFQFGFIGRQWRRFRINKTVFQTASFITLPLPPSFKSAPLALMYAGIHML